VAVSAVNPTRLRGLETNSNAKAKLDIFDIVEATLEALEAE
jgi:hypothetical protein